MNNLDTKIDPNHAENTATVSQIFNFTNKYPKTQERKMIWDIKKGQAYEKKICLLRQWASEKFSIYFILWIPLLTC